MKQTALQILIENLYLLKRNSLDSDSDRGGDYRIGLSQAIVEATALLPTEKQQIIDAFNNGYKNGKIDIEDGTLFNDGNNYYNSTFKGK